MDWNLINIVSAALLVIVFIVTLYAARQFWKMNSKFQAFLMLAIAAATAVGFYAIYGKDIFG